MKGTLFTGHKTYSLALKRSRVRFLCPARAFSSPLMCKPLQDKQTMAKKVYIETTALLHFLSFLMGLTYLVSSSTFQLNHCITLCFAQSLNEKLNKIEYFCFWTKKNEQKRILYYCIPLSIIYLSICGNIIAMHRSISRPVSPWNHTLSLFLSLIFFHRFILSVFFLTSNCKHIVTGVCRCLRAVACCVMPSRSGTQPAKARLARTKLTTGRNSEARTGFSTSLLPCFAVSLLPRPLQNRRYHRLVRWNNRVLLSFFFSLHPSALVFHSLGKQRLGHSTRLILVCCLVFFLQTIPRIQYLRFV